MDGRRMLKFRGVGKKGDGGVRRQRQRETKKGDGGVRRQRQRERQRRVTGVSGDRDRGETKKGDGGVRRQRQRETKKKTRKKKEKNNVEVHFRTKYDVNKTYSGIKAKLK